MVAIPSHDVARFLMDLKRMGLEILRFLHALDRAAELFLKTYIVALAIQRTLPFSSEQPAWSA